MNHSQQSSCAQLSRKFGARAELWCQIHVNSLHIHSMARGERASPAIHIPCYSFRHSKSYDYDDKNKSFTYNINLTIMISLKIILQLQLCSYSSLCIPYYEVEMNNFPQHTHIANNTNQRNKQTTKPTTLYPEIAKKTSWFLGTPVFLIFPVWNNKVLILSYLNPRGQFPFLVKEIC